MIKRGIPVFNKKVAGTTPFFYFLLSPALDTHAYTRTRVRTHNNAHRRTHTHTHAPRTHARTRLRTHTHTRETTNNRTHTTTHGWTRTLNACAVLVPARARVARLAAPGDYTATQSDDGYQIAVVFKRREAHVRCRACVAAEYPSVSWNACGGGAHEGTIVMADGDWVKLVFSDVDVRPSSLVVARNKLAVDWMKRCFPRVCPDAAASE